MGRHKSPLMTEARKIKEREANLFAMLLLMPEKHLREDLKEVGEIDLLGSLESDVKIAKLAEKYKVTSVMMTMRLVILYDKGY